LARSPRRHAGSRARRQHGAHFYKNLAIIGGLLLVALQGAGRYSADGQMSQGSRSWIFEKIPTAGKRPLGGVDLHQILVRNLMRPDPSLI
jgi:hypothetical protein